MNTVNFKLVLLGDSAVGKSSCVNRFVKDEFLAFQQPTIGAAFMTNTVHLSDVVVKFEIWDTAGWDFVCFYSRLTRLIGQERYRSLAPMYYRGAACALVVFDITDRTSFEGAKSWIEELYTQGSPEVIVALAGNKVDLDSSRVVETDEAQAYCSEHGCIYLETSAKTGQNINKIFQEIAKAMPKTSTDAVPEKKRQFVSLSEKKNLAANAGCC